MTRTPVVEHGRGEGAVGAAAAWTVVGAVRQERPAG